MNKIYRVIWSKTKNCYVVASELAKRHTKAPQSGVVNKIAALALVGAMSFGFAGSAWAAPQLEDTYIKIGSTGQQDPASVTGGLHAIAIGENAKVSGDANDRADYSVGIGYGVTATGVHGVVMGKDATITASHAIGIGAGVSAEGMYTSVLGAYSDVSIDSTVKMVFGDDPDDPEKVSAMQGFGTTVLGSLNSSRTDVSKDENKDKKFISVASSIVGTVNTATDSNGSLIFGAGNEITDSYQNVLFDEADMTVSQLHAKYKEAVESGDRAKMAEIAAQLRKMVKVSGGQVMAMGGSNSASNAYRSQIMGVGNVLEGSMIEMIDPSTGAKITADTDSTAFRVYDTQYDLLDGFENTVKHSEHVSVIGTGNEVLNSNGNIIIGDLHGISGGGNNIIIGSSATPSDEAAVLEGFQAVQHTADIENTVMLGYNTDVRVSKGVALGSDSIAKTGAGVVGYDPVTGKASKLTSSTWVATAAAISVGNEKKTWYGFSESGLQSAIEDNKSALEALGVDTSLAPADLLASLNDEQLNLLKSHLDYDERISETRPEQAETLYVASPGSGTTRQITNVAAGFNDTDAVNVAQLKSTSTHYYSVNTTKEMDEEENSNYSNDGAIGNNALAAGVHASAVGVASTSVGNYADAQGLMSTVVGSNSKATDSMASILVEIKQASAAAVGTGSSDKQMLMNMINPVIQKMPSVVSAGSTVIGNFNTIDNNEDTITKAQALITALKNNGGTQIATKAVQYLDSVKAFDGVSNTLVGSLNTTTDSNVAVIYGTGNSIVNSYENFEAALDTIKNVDIDSIVAGLSGGRIQKALALLQLQNVFNGLNNMGTATQLQECIENNDFEGIKDILSNYIKENGGKGGRSIAIGTNNVIENAKQAITIGTNNNVTGDKSIAIGIGHKISGANSGAFGDPSTISGNNSYAIGNSNTIVVTDAFILGNNAQATADNVVALGNKSIAGAAATVNGYDPVTGTAHVLDDENDLQIIPVWKATAGTVSVGGGTTKRKNEQGQYLNAAGRVVTRESQAADIPVTRQITNVAAGSALTDAVNVAQLMAAQVEIVAGDNVEVIKENSNGHTKYTIHSLNAMIAEKGENITVTADTPEKTEETNGKTTDLTAEGDGTTGGSGSTGDTGGTTAEPTPSPEGEQITPSETNNHTTTYTINATDTRNTVKAGENITVKEKNNDDGSITYTISAQAATNVKVIDGENTTVTEGTEGEFTTYAVNVKTDGKVAPGDTGIVTGDTVYNETRVKKDGNYIKKDNTAAENITALDEKVKDNSTRIDNINNQFGDLDNRMRKGLAGAAALAALHPMDFNPDDKMQFSAGVGHYRGETAAAIGAFYRPDESVMFSIGGTFGNSDNMINAGITFGLDGTRNRITRSRTAMAREIQDLRSLVTQMAARMDRLEGANVETAMFPDVPENHWAYEYVEDLQKRGALKGYPDGLFKGDRAMTRYEFAAMLDRLVRSGVMLDSKIAKEFEPELGRIYVERISGQDNDRKKVERVRVNNSDSKYPEGKTRDVYGSKIVIAVAEKAVAK